MRKYLLLLLLALALSLSACGSAPEPGPDPAPDQENEPMQFYGSCRWDEQGQPFANFEMTVPLEIYDVFPGDAALAVSNELTAFAEKESDAWQDEQAAMRQQVPDLDSEFTLDLTLFYHDEEIVAVTGDGYSYVSGAAHPNIYAYGFVFDAETGQRIAIGQLLGEDWQEKLFPAIVKQINDGGEQELYFQDLEPLLPEAFREEGWYADGDSVYVVYDPAEIAPYALGTPCFKLPR